MTNPAPNTHTMCLPAQEKRYLLQRIRFLETAVTNGLARESSIESTMVESNRAFLVMTNAYRATIRRLEIQLSRRNNVQRALFFDTSEASSEDTETDEEFILE
jgi:hypothetical protein